MSLVKFKSFAHWEEWWGNSIPYSEPMDVVYLNRIKKEFPTISLNNIVWLAFIDDDEIKTARVTSLTKLDIYSHSFEIFNCNSNDNIELQWLDIVDYEIEANGK